MCRKIRFVLKLTLLITFYTSVKFIYETKLLKGQKRRHKIEISDVIRLSNGSAAQAIQK